MAKHDWLTIRREYVEGYDEGGRVLYPTMEELAKRHACGPSLLRSHASAEDWMGERDKFRTKVIQAREAKRSSLLGREGAAFDARMLRFAASLMKLVERAKRERGKLKGTPDELAIARIGVAARHAQTIAKVALGEADAEIVLPPAAAGSVTATIRVSYEKAPLPDVG